MIRVSLAGENIHSATAQVTNHIADVASTGADDVEDRFDRMKSIGSDASIRYNDLSEGTTLEYILVGNDIKENIILKQPSDEYSYSFVYELQGMTAMLNEDGSISFVDSTTLEQMYRIPAPYMYDAANNISYDVVYSLHDLGNGTYNISVTADANWINEAGRAFPVTIDPTLTFEASFWDTYIDASHPNENYEESEKLWVSAVDTTFINYLELPELPSNATISRAFLNLYYYYYVSSGELSVGLYPVNVEWEEDTWTWNMANQYENLGISSNQLAVATLPASSSITESTPGIASMNVTELVKSWYGGASNFGVALKYEGGTNNSVIIKSWEASLDAVAYYEITYYTSDLAVAPGTYLFCNGEYDNRYMQIDNDALVSDENAILELWDFDGADDQKWEIEYLHNGYYRIMSVASGKAITAPSTTELALRQKEYSMADNQQWKILKTASGMYKIYPRSNTSCYMAAGSGIGTSKGRNVKIRSAQSDNKDEWNLYRLDGTDAMLLGIKSPDHDHITALVDIMPDLAKLGCQDFNYIDATTISKKDLEKGMRAANIFISRSHGGTSTTESYICLYNEGYPHFGASDIYNFTNDTPVINLSHCDLMIFAACKSGDMGNRSLPYAAVSAGAAHAIGFSGSIICSEANTWLKYFMQFYQEGENIYDAAQHASEQDSSLPIGSVCIY